jgi:hypothetical protein
LWYLLLYIGLLNTLHSNQQYVTMQTTISVGSASTL